MTHEPICVSDGPTLEGRCVSCGYRRASPPVVRSYAETMRDEYEYEYEHEDLDEHEYEDLSLKEGTE